MERNTRGSENPCESLEGFRQGASRSTPDSIEQSFPSAPDDGLTLSSLHISGIVLNRHLSEDQIEFDLNPTREPWCNL